MVALCNRADHNIFALWFLLSFFSCLISAVGNWMSTILPTCCGLSANSVHVWNVLHAARWKYRMQKNRHFGTIAQLCRAISSELTLRHVSTIGKNLLDTNTSSRCPDNMVNFGLLTAEICWRVWRTPANFNGFRVLAALLHGTLVMGVSQTLRRWTEGATYIWQGDHHVGYWPTF